MYKHYATALEEVLGCLLSSPGLIQLKHSLRYEPFPTKPRNNMLEKYAVW